jgi:hypothetical protein
MSAFAESLDDALVAHEVERMKFKRVSTENFNQGQLIGHKPTTYAMGEEFELCDIYFVDDGAFPFGEKEILIQAAPIIYEHLAKFQLEMHVGTLDEFGVETASKTECVFFPPPNFFKPAPMIGEATPDNEAATALVTKPKQESATTRAGRESKLYDQAPETRRIMIGENSFIDFTRIFKYLGTLISFDLRDDADIKMRIKKASQAMGRMKNVWEDKYVDKETKYLFFLAIPINLLLWGCETWALKAESVKNLDVFIHRSVRRILGIRMQQVKDERITNKKVREMFFNLPSAQEMVAARQLSYLGKMVRNHDEEHLPLKLLTAWVNNKRPTGGVLYTNKRSITTHLNLILPAIPEKPDADERSLEVKNWKRLVEERRTGKLNQWIEMARDEEYWEWLIDSKLRKPHLNTPEPRRREQQNNQQRSNPPPPPRNEQSNHPPTPPRRRNAPPSPRNQNYNPNGVGRSTRDSLACIGLQRGATEREIRVKFRQLSRIYHPDRHKSDETGLTDQQAKEKFQEINNAYSYLCETL